MFREALPVCMYVCVYVCVCVCMCVCEGDLDDDFLVVGCSMRRYLYVSVFVCMYVYMCVCVYVHLTLIKTLLNARTTVHV